MEGQRLCVRVAEACNMLAISRSTLFKASIPYSKVAGCRVYRIADLEAYLEAHKVKEVQ